VVRRRRRQAGASEPVPSCNVLGRREQGILPRPWDRQSETAVVAEVRPYLAVLPGMFGTRPLPSSCYHWLTLVGGEALISRRSSASWPSPCCA
jgi:hypothetical protein